MGCAATTTIRRIVDDLTNPYWERLPGENPEAQALAAVASLEQLVEAAQAAVERAERLHLIGFAPLAAALAAVGPGEETAG